MKKVAFVVQRYGTEVNGGAETLARQLAMQLSKNYDVDILTTKALDYITWEDYYEKDCEVIDGVNVKRFSVDKTRDIKSFQSFVKRFLITRLIYLSRSKLGLTSKAHLLQSLYNI